MNKNELKQQAVDYLGGCCILCGYHRCLRALHFHHLNPFEKDFNISEKYSWEEIKEEIEKCVLLCANCHAEAHSGIITPETLVDLTDKI